MSAAVNRRLTFDDFGDIEALRLAIQPIPEPGPDEVRVRVSVAGLNPVDWQIVESCELAAHFGITAAADLHGLETALAALHLGAPPGRVVTIEADLLPPGIGIVNGADARPDALEQLAELIIAGRLSLPVEAAYPLEDFQAAISRQRERHTHGKLALLISATTAHAAR